MTCQEHEMVSKQFLQSQKLKATPIRLELLDIFTHHKKPLSIKELKKLLSGKGDVVTLYRNVEALTELGFIHRIRLADKQNYYESAQNSHHHHLVCTTCGKVSDIAACRVPVLSSEVLKASGFAKVKNHSLEFFGLCKQCV